MLVKDILKLDQGVQLKATLLVFNGEEKLVGPGKLELLQFIQETGSISQAAKKMGLSYKKAWDRINSLNLPTPPRWKKQPTLMPSFRGASL
jgi:molybdate transport system regulatory protein